MANLVADSSGNLFGTTSADGMGANADGTAFEIPAGGGPVRTLYTFSYSSSDFAGGNPQCTLIIDGSGNLIGTEAFVGANGVTVFSLNPVTQAISSVGSVNLITLTSAGVVADSSRKFTHGTAEQGSTGPGTSGGVIRVTIPAAFTGTGGPSDP